MRERNILYALLALNLAVLVAFGSCLALSTISETSPAQGLKPADQDDPGTSRGNTLPSRPAPRIDPDRLEQASARRASSRDVVSPDYPLYLERLREAGCPEVHVRHIVISDVREHIAQHRLEEAVRHDFEWWRAEPQPIVTRLLREKGEELRQKERDLMRRLLGASPDRDSTAFWSHMQLTGAVLGALSEELHAKVQEICAEWLIPGSADPAAAGTLENPLEMARARDRFRLELARVLREDELEQFLLRYSDHATRVRAELRALQPSPDEFRAFFRVVEPIDRDLESVFGSVAALGPTQRENFIRRRDEAVRGALSPPRFQVYMLARHQ